MGPPRSRVRSSSIQKVKGARSLSGLTFGKRLSRDHCRIPVTRRASNIQFIITKGTKIHRPPSPPISRPGSPTHVSGQKEEDFGEPTRVSCHNSEGKARMLDLFSGTVSTAAAFRKMWYEVVTLDYDRKFSPDILTDVLAWDYQSTFAPGYFENIAASPPCTEYSIAMTCRA